MDLIPLSLKPYGTGKKRAKGFSRGELEKAGFNLRDAKTLGLPFDRRRKTVHEWNVKMLLEYKSKMTETKSLKKETKVREGKAREAKAVKVKPEKVKSEKTKPEKTESKGTPIAEIKGVGPKTAEKFINAGIDTVEKLLEHSVEELAEKTGISSKKLSKIIENARMLSVA